MAIIQHRNMNPGMSQMHHPATHEGEGPHVIYSPEHLADRMGRLNSNQDRVAPNGDPRTRDVTPNADTNEHADAWYLGYTFFKAQPNPGHRATWTKAEKNRMNLSQNDLVNLVQKKAKKTSFADQYQSLTMLKRSHVDRLIENLRQSHPQFQWMCVYVKEDTREVKGKNFCRGDYETMSMDIILMGKPVASYPNREPLETGIPAHLKDRVPTQFGHPLPENEPRIFTKGDQHNEQWSGAHFHQSSMPPPPPQMHNIHQHGPPPVPHPPLPQHPVGVPQYPLQGPWPQGVPVGAPHASQPTPVVHNHMRSNPEYNPATGPHETGTRSVPPGPVPHNQRQVIPQQQPIYSHNADASQRRGKSPMQSLGSEPELVYESSSSGDEEMLSLDHDYGNSEVGFSNEVTEVSNEQAPWRGSLFRRYSSEKSKHSNPVYRTHYRKQPQKVAVHNNRHREDIGVDLTSADSRHTPRGLEKVHSSKREMVRHRWSHPEIEHPRVSFDDLDLAYVNHLRGGRVQNDIRSHFLNNWESNLEEREKLIEINNRILNDRIDDIGFLDRYRSLREPGVSYPRRYLPDALH